MTDTSSTRAGAPTGAAAADPLTLWVAGGAPALAEEALDLWACGYAAWGSYLTQMAGATTPEAWLEANTRLMSEGLRLCTRATALRLRQAGVSQPLLNDG